MSDNLHLRGKPDRDRVNVHEPWEVTHWCGKFNCTEAQLKAAVRAVGVMARDVEAYLRRRLSVRRTCPRVLRAGISRRLPFIRQSVVSTSEKNIEEKLRKNLARDVVDRASC